jgi:hypothetical protein
MGAPTRLQCFDFSTHFGSLLRAASGALNAYRQKEENMRRLTIGTALTLGLLLFGSGCGEITIPAPGSGCEADENCNEAGTCRAGSCVDGVCSYTVQPGFCFIEGQCFNDGQSAPGDACKLCNPKLNATTYVNKVCDTGLCNPKTGSCEGGGADTFTSDDLSSADTEPTPEDTTPEDTAPEDIAPEDTAPEDTAPEDTPPPTPAVTCDTYCTNMTTACQAEFKQYDTMEDCVLFCTKSSAAMPKGSDGDTAINSLSCRNYHALVAQEEPTVHCAHAGPLGGGVCGTYCGTYCDFASANCFGNHQIYDDYTDCTQACKGFEKSGNIFDVSGDTLQCRFQYLTQAANEPENACPNAAQDGGAACVCIPSCPANGCGFDNGCGEPCGCAKGEECIDGTCIEDGVIVGDTCAAPFVINQLPYVDKNNNGAYTHKYAACLDADPNAGVAGPDVVYAYTATQVMQLSIAIKGEDGGGAKNATLLSWDVSCPMGNNSCQTKDFYADGLKAKSPILFCTEKGTTYYFIVDSLAPLEVGAYQLHVNQGVELCGGGVDK